MGVYINIEMPKSCDKCPFCDGEAWCLIPGDWRLRYNIAHGERLSTCPLVHVPEHGRLGDLDELHKEAVRRSEKAGTHDIWYNCTDRVICALDIKNAPTIIPAEPAEEEKN